MALPKVRAQDRMATVFYSTRPHQQGDGTTEKYSVSQV